MPDTTYLHIQGRDSDPTRVLELPANGVRIGRGAQCEVRLADPGLADVQCIVRLRGNAWHLQPVGPSGLVLIEGQPVEHLRPLPLGLPLQVGSHRLVLRPSEWGSFQAPIDIPTRFSATRSVEPEPAIGARPTSPTPTTDAEVERLRRWQTRLEQRERWLQDRQQEKKWESRWKAAGEGLRARSTPAPAPPRPEVKRPVTPPPPPPPIQPQPRITSRVATTRPAPSPPPIAVSRPEPTVVPSAPAPLRQPEPPPIQRALPAPSPEPVVVFDLSESFERNLAAVLQPEPAVDMVAPSPEETPVATIESAWTQPQAFVADVHESSTVVWHEDTYQPPPVVEPPVRPAPRREPPPPPSTPPIAPTAAPTERGEFPSARAIFASQGTRTLPTTTTRKRKRGPVPTEAIAPSQWTMPVWVGLPPALLASVAMIAVGMTLGLWWTKDNLDVGLAARAAMRAEDARPVPLDPTFRPPTQWWRTTAEHATLWAAAIELSPEAPERAAEVNENLAAALNATPLAREARLARATSVEAGEPVAPSRSVGLSRDVATLSFTGRSLRVSGKKAASILAYRRAIELASGADPSRAAAPTFDDDPQVRRYKLPRESLIGSVVRDMLRAGEWSIDEWKRALPPIAVARLAAARILREGSSPETEKVIDLVLDSDVVEPTQATFAAEHFAARAEALAFKNQKDEAAAQYRKAVDLATDDPTRRRWRLGLAEILATLGAGKERDELLEAAKGLDPNDEVTRKALEAQKFAGLK